MLARVMAAAAMLACIAAGRDAGANDFVQSWNFSTRARWESAVAVHSPVDQKLEVFIEPTLQMELAGGFQLTAIGRLRSDPANQLRPDNPKELELWKPTRNLRFGDYTQLGLRELYVERRLGRAHLTIGKQQVVWGTSDGLKVLDLVNPQDFREFILEDFVDSRIPTWMANVTFPIAMFQAQLLWIPDRSYAEQPLPGSVYAFRSPQIVPPNPLGLPVTVDHPDRPTDGIGGSEIGARLRTTVGKSDLTLNYLWAYDDVAVPYRRFTLGAGGPGIEVTPRYKRTSYVGGTINRTIGNWVVRSEVAVSTDRHVYTLDPTDTDGVRNGNETNAVVGLDWFGLTDTLVSVQFFGRYTSVDHSSDSPQAGWTTIPTFLVRRSMIGDRLIAQLFWLQDAGRGDGMGRLSLRWEMRDDLALLGGTDIFYGSSKGIFGEFEDATRFVFGIESTF